MRKHLRPEELGDLLEQPLVAVRGIEVRAEARLESAPPGTAHRIAIRYLGGRDGAAYAASAPDDTLIRLEPGRLRAWDFADDM